MEAACRSKILLGRIRILTAVFIAGLLLSGATAIPLEAEVDWLVKTTDAGELARGRTGTEGPAWAVWLVRVQSALGETRRMHPLLFYGTDWLAFGHFAIALAFVGALRYPVRNRWLFSFGLLACAFVIPYALIFGALRQIPFWWRLIDCSFGVMGSLPLWLCQRWTAELERTLPKKSPTTRFLDRPPRPDKQRDEQQTAAGA